MLLNYNGTNHSVSTTDTGLTRSYSTELVIPSVFIETNITLFFIATLSDGEGITTIYTNEQNQTTQDLNQSVEDNETNEICLIEGETGIESCCEGLESVSCVEYVNGECLYADCGHTCTYCGNGECGPGENVCNCPDDCDAGDKPTETVMDYLVYGFGLLVLILVIYVIYNHFSKPKTMKPNKTVGKNQTSKKKK